MAAGQHSWAHLTALCAASYQDFAPPGKYNETRAAGVGEPAWLLASTLMHARIVL
jgi:hypothetical protein